LVLGVEVAIRDMVGLDIATMQVYDTAEWLQNILYRLWNNDNVRN